MVFDNEFFDVLHEFFRFRAMYIAALDYELL